MDPRLYVVYDEVYDLKMDDIVLVKHADEDAVKLIRYNKKAAEEYCVIGLPIHSTIIVIKDRDNVRLIHKKIVYSDITALFGPSLQGYLRDIGIRVIVNQLRDHIQITNNVSNKRFIMDDSDIDYILKHVV